ncbi:MAG TPA: hypothetical protein VNZ57_08775 [Longimicrobiales bacterium]|nr:hypothetical protein [Longimicrobiales bacterium]
MRRLRITGSAVIAGALALIAAPLHGQAPDAEAFVAAFGEVCIPERLSPEGTLALAERTGWIRLEAGDDEVIDRLFALSRAEIESDIVDGLITEFAATGFRREIEGRTLHLAVSLVRSQYIDLLGCALYDFAATAPIDSSPVSRLLETERAYATDGSNPDYAVDPAILVGTVWGPPPGLPRTWDTYLSFVPPDSPLTAQVGVSGLMLKFETSLPD